MKNKFRLANISVVMFFLFAGFGRGGTEGFGDNSLKIYLPREAVVKDDSLNLDAIGVVRGEDTLVAKAKSVSLGKFSLTGQRITLDRQTILSRLASSGIDSDNVVISGAKYITVRRQEETVDGSRIVEVARQFLQRRMGSSTARVVAITRPAPYIHDERSGQIELVPRLSKYSTETRPKVWVGVFQDGVEKKGYEISFNLRYESRTAVTTVDISPGTVINAENVKIEKTESTTPAQKWSSPYGMIATRMIRKGTTLKGSMIEPAQKPLLVKRRQTILVKVETGGFYISSFGEALEEGRLGQFIRVKMGDSRDARIIVGKVSADGSVAPSL